MPFVLRADITTNPQVFDFDTLIPETSQGNWKINLVNWAIYSTDYIVSSANNSFTVTYLAVNHVITIPNGNYYPQSLMTAINTAVVAELGVLWSFTLNSVTGMFTLTGPGAFTITTVARSAKLLGFDVGVLSSVANAYTGPYLPYCASSPWYGVTLSGAAFPGNDPNNYSYRIPITAVPGSLNMGIGQNFKGNSVYIYNGIGTVTINIYDQFGDNLDFLGQPLMLILEMDLTGDVF